MNQDWSFALDFSILGAFLIFATYLRGKVKLLQKYIIPNSIIAGFIMLAVGAQGLGVVNYDTTHYGDYVYHLLAITFIAMSLRNIPFKGTKAIHGTGLLYVLGYSVQALIGLIIVLFFIKTISPDLFPNFGFFVMLGFGQGPGQAYSLGKSWELAGFENAADIGLSFAAIGFIWASAVGIILIFLLKRYFSEHQSHILDSEEYKRERKGWIKNTEEQPCAGKLTTSSSAIDGFTFQIAIVVGVYLLTYGFLNAIEYILYSINEQSKLMVQLNNLFWGVHFIWASLLAILVRKIIHKFGYKTLLDNGLLTRISGTSLDFMVTASIAAISISAISKYIGIILIMTTLGGIATIALVFYEIKRSGFSHPYERILGIFGTLTGTLSTGLTLVRIIDKDFKTPVAQDLVFGAGLATPYAAPLILSVIVPIIGVQNNMIVEYLLYTIAGISIYTFILYLNWRYLIRKSAKL